MAFTSPSSSAFFPPNGLSSYFDIDAYGADPTGHLDSTIALQNAFNAASGNGIVECPGNTYFFNSAAITVPGNVSIRGVGTNVTIFQIGPNFSGSSFLSLSGVSFVNFLNLSIQGASLTYSSNPACDAVGLSGVTDTFFDHVEMDYINGYGINSIATSSIGNQKIAMKNVKVHQGASGFHAQGVSGSSNVGLHQFFECNASGIQSGDCYLLEDIHDIQMTDCGGEVTAGSGYSLHVKGVCGAVFCENPDFGPAIQNGNPIVLVEASGNGNPQSVYISGGILEGGTQGINVTAGGYVEVVGTRFFNNSSYGINTTGGTIIAIGCEFDGNGSGSGTYDIRNNGASYFLVKNCLFNSTQGTGAGEVVACVNDIGQTVVWESNEITGTNFTLTNYYNNQPLIDNNTRVKLLPNGTSITAPVIGASPYTPAAKSNNYAVYVEGGTVSNIKIGGVSTGQIAGLFIVPAQQTITLVYSVAPTWTWFRI